MEVVVFLPKIHLIVKQNINLLFFEFDIPYALPSELGDIPKDWKVVLLGCLLDGIMTKV
jgi:hypothetical protein